MTHAGRLQGAKHAELNGVNDGQIRRAGRWSSDALTSCYLTLSGPIPFARDNYQTFTEDVELSLLEVEEPEEVQIRKSLPAQRWQ